VSRATVRLRRPADKDSCRSKRLNSCMKPGAGKAARCVMRPGRAPSDRRTGETHAGKTAMTGTTRSSADIEPRRKRILFRCWHRGIREMDLVLGSFADAEIETLSEAELDELEAIMAEHDRDLVMWVTGERPVPDRFRTGLFPRICAFTPDFSPVTAETFGKTK
jgi:antitoxin CptB